MKEEKRDRDREGLGERLRRTLELDGDVLSGGYTLEVRGGRSATLRGAGRILVYTPEEIRFELKEGEISFYGKGLICASYCSDSVGIEGRMERIVFEEGEK